jgi:rare lipoprotein A
VRRWIVTGVALVLAACGSSPKAPPSARYYLDDGPPERVPDNLSTVPDAEPRDEPFHRFANRPYTVFGQTYVPVVNKEPRRERGFASWYGRKFHGQKTASGEPYDMFAMTAAHRTLPIPSFVRVTNPKNGKSVVVRVNDRGPFHANRIIDLSYAAAARIGIVNDGAALVEIERIVPGDAAGAGTGSSMITAQPAPASVQTPLVEQEAAGMWLQLGAFASPEGAETFRDRVRRELTWLLEPVHLQARDGLHRVRLGPYRTREEATAIADKVRQSLGLVPIITR